MGVLRTVHDAWCRHPAARRRAKESSNLRMRADIEVDDDNYRGRKTTRAAFFGGAGERTSSLALDHWGGGRQGLGVAHAHVLVCTMSPLISYLVGVHALWEGPGSDGVYHRIIVHYRGRGVRWRGVRWGSLLPGPEHGCPAAARRE